MEANSYSEFKAEEHHTVHGERKVELKADDHLTVGDSQHVKLGRAYLARAGREIHLKAGQKMVIEADSELTVKAGGSFIRLDASGIAIAANLPPRQPVCEECLLQAKKRGQALAER